MYDGIPDDRKSFLADVIIIAIEGGFMEWARIDAYDQPDETPEETFVNLTEIGDGGERNDLGTLDINIIDLGIHRIAANEIRINNGLARTILRASLEYDAGQIDAIAADAVVQAGLFAKLVYG